MYGPPGMAITPVAPSPLDKPVSDMTPPMGDIGISGTANRRGDIFSEYNAKLYHQAGFGQSGSRVWGAWEHALRTDSAVASGVEFNAAKVRDARISVVPGDDSPLAKQIARFVRWNVTQALEPGWPALSQQMVYGLMGFGFFIMELVAAPCYHPDLPGGRGWKLARLEERLPVSLHTNAWIEEDGKLVGVRQRGLRNGNWEEVVLPADRILLSTWNRNGANYAGFPQTRSVWYATVIREQLLKQTGIAAIREASGLPVATAADYAEPLDKDQREEMFNVLSTLVGHEAAAVVMPKGWSVEWVYSPGANKGGVLDLYHRLGQVILQLFQAQQLDLGTGDTGSRSVGEVHAGSAGSFVKGITANIEGSWNGSGERAYEGVIRKLVDWNFGPQQNYPKLKIDVQPPALAPDRLVSSLKDAVAAGVLTPTLDVENAVREQLGFQAIDIATRQALQPSVPPVLQPDIFGQTPNQPAHPPPGAAIAGPKPKADQLAPVAQARHLVMSDSGAFAAARELRSSEKLLDLARMDSFLNRAREEFERGAKPLVVELLTRALPDVREAMKDGDPSEIATLKLDGTRLEEFIGQFLEKARAEGYAQVKQERARGTEDAVAKERAAGGQKFAPIVHADPPEDPKDVATRTEAVLEAQRKLLARRMLARLQEAMERQAIEVIRTGGTPSDVVTQTVMDQLESGSLKADGGSVLTKAWNMGREQFAEERGNEVASVELSAILDKANCQPCADLDGEEFEFGSDEHYAHTPPLASICDGADNCRCLLIYNFRDSQVGDE